MAAADFLVDMNDYSLKPRLLRSLLRDRLPLAGDDGRNAVPPPAELASVLAAVREHGLLTERLPGQPDPKLAEAWCAAVDAWVERLVALLSTEKAHSCWVGTCFLGLTFKECSTERFAKSYPEWFEKVLKNLQTPSSTQVVHMVSCTAMADLFMRLAKFSNLKKEATSFAGRVVQPVLLLLDENGPVADKAVDLLCAIITLYPSCINRYYDKVEAAIASKVMNREVNLQVSKSFASCLALLPYVRVAEDGWSLMIKKILIVVNNLLSDAFLGLEEEKRSSEIMMMLVPPGNDPPPPLGGQQKSGEARVHATKKFRVLTVPTVSALIHCCSVMLTNPYPVQVTIPVRTLIALVRRVLLVDGSLRKSLFPSTTSLHQELICFELPSLHLSFLDLLIAIIKGIRSQLLPHAANVGRLITEYFGRAKLPAIRIKVYTVVRLLLTSMGIGMSLHLLQEVVNNAFADLDDSYGSNSLSLNKNLANESSLKSYSRKRKHPTQRQHATVLDLEKVVVNPKKMKNASRTQALSGLNAEPTTVGIKLTTPLCVKIAALQTLEILLSVGGSLRIDYWRSEMDLLLITVARNACDMGGGYGQRLSSPAEKPSTPELLLTSLRALLASFLSSHVRPPYLAQGLELFSRGKQETGTELAAFCSHALLALDVLMHPQALPLERTVPGSSGICTAPGRAVFGTGKSSLLPLSGNGPHTMHDLDNGEEMYVDWLATSEDDDEPADALVKQSAAGKHVAVESSRAPAAQQDDQQLMNDTAVFDEADIDSSKCPEAVGDVPKSSSNIDVEMAAARTEGKNEGFDKNIESNSWINPSTTEVVSTPISAASPHTQKAGVDLSSKKHSDLGSDLHKKSFVVGISSTEPNRISFDEDQIASAGASNSEKGPENAPTNFYIPTDAKLFDSDSDSLDSLPDVVDADPDSD